MENLVDLIANIGFPIGITLYLLIRIEGRLEKLTESIEKLARNLEK